MHVPRIVTFMVGVLCGGAVVYVSDETNGARRRRTALRDVARLAARVLVWAITGAYGAAKEFRAVSRDTFIQERAGRQGASPT